jgi:hypothetical protein
MIRPIFLCEFYQVAHLFWLGGEVVATRLTGEALFTFAGVSKVLILLVDYTEIPALIAVSLVYIDDLRKGFAWKPLIYLIFLNSQWLHLFWITDEFVVDKFAHGAAIILPAWLAWVAILIDYLEVPVIIETFIKFGKALKERRAVEFLKTELREID